jgi:hypothetical protein
MPPAVNRRLLTLAAVASLVLCVAICVVMYWSFRAPRFWVRESDAAPHRYGDRGEARFFRGYYLKHGRLGWDEVRLTRAAVGFSWFSRQSDDAPPEQDVLLGALGSGTGGAGTWSVRLWPFALALGVLPLIVASTYVRAARRARLGRCPTCGYDLRATPARCPECGGVPGPVAVTDGAGRAGSEPT